MNFLYFNYFITFVNCVDHNTCLAGFSKCLIFINDSEDIFPLLMWLMCLVKWNVVLTVTIFELHNLVHFKFFFLSNSTFILFVGSDKEEEEEEEQEEEKKANKVESE